MLHVYVEGETMRCVFEYRGDLFAPQTVERWAQQYLEILRQAVAAPDLALSALVDRISHRGRQDRPIAARVRAIERKVIPISL